MTTYEQVERPTTSTMPAWPTADDVRTQLGVPAGAGGDALTAAVAAAVDQVKIDTGWDTDPPIPSQLWSAALLLAVVTTKDPDAPHGIAAVFDTGALYVARDHPSYWRLLRGHRRGWGVA